MTKDELDQAIEEINKVAARASQRATVIPETARFACDVLTYMHMLDSSIIDPIIVADDLFDCRVFLSTHGEPRQMYSKLISPHIRDHASIALTALRIWEGTS